MTLRVDGMLRSRAALFALRLSGGMLARDGSGPVQVGDRLRSLSGTRQWRQGDRVSPNRECPVAGRPRQAWDRGERPSPKGTAPATTFLYLRDSCAASRD